MDKQRRVAGEFRSIQLSFFVALPSHSLFHDLPCDGFLHRCHSLFLVDFFVLSRSPALRGLLKATQWLTYTWFYSTHSRSTERISSSNVASENMRMRNATAHRASALLYCMYYWQTPRRLISPTYYTHTVHIVHVYASVLPKTDPSVSYTWLST